MIRPISIAEALPVRQSVLWPGHPLDHARVPGDEAARHFGWFGAADLIAVGSLFQDGPSVQLRKFAALPEVQGQGIGTALLTHMVAECRGSGAGLLWCDSRLDAMGFYARLGFTSTGSAFEKRGRPYHRMQLQLC
jgi:GNAT superfamily N-acetyltransferase